MKPAPSTSNSGPSSNRHHPWVVAGASLLLGAALAGAWFQNHRAGTPRAELSPATQHLLAQLPAPVALRYYSLLPAGTADAALQAFAGRVAQLLNAVQAAAGGKVEITDIDKVSEANSLAASAEGMLAFNLDKGDACFLGVAIAGGKNKEALGRLQPEWEPALEYDLARAIARVAAAAAPAKPAPKAAQSNPEIVTSINRLIPDVRAVTTEQADQIFHDEFLKQCGEVGAEMEALVNAAQQEMVQAQSGGTPADVEAARKKLLQAQLAQGEKLKAIAADLQARMALFQQLKAGTNSASQ